MGANSFDVINVVLPRDVENVLSPPTGENELNLRMRQLSGVLRELETNRIEPAVRSIVKGGVKELVDATSPAMKEAQEILSKYEAYQKAEMKKIEEEEAALDEVRREMLRASFTLFSNSSLTTYSSSTLAALYATTARSALRTRSSSARAATSVSIRLVTVWRVSRRGTTSAGSARRRPRRG